MQLHGWEGVLFYVLAIMTLFMAVFVVTARVAVHSALFLIATLVNVALLFILLRAEFVAGVQILKIELRNQKTGHVGAGTAYAQDAVLQRSQAARFQAAAPQAASRVQQMRDPARGWRPLRGGARRARDVGSGSAS